MKILFTLPYIPIPATFGGAIRVSHMMKIAARHHEVTILTFGRPGEEKGLRDLLGEKVTIHIVRHPRIRDYRRLGQLFSLFSNHSFFYKLVRSVEMKNTLHCLLGEHNFDIVQTEFAHTAAYDLPTSAVKILDAHNVEYDNFKRMHELAHSPLRKFHYYREYKKFHTEEHDACLRYDAVFTTSQRDK